MIEGQQYKLQCDVHIVAKSVDVRWYKGQTLVNQNNFNSSLKTRETKTVILPITPDRSDDGVQYRCEAELEPGAEGPSHTLETDPLNITVYYKPIINETKLPSIVSVVRGYEMVLVCEAEGNPKPTISWNIGTNNPDYRETFTVTDSTPENLSCNASNSVDFTTRHVKVSIQENNILIILCIIAAAVVVVISIISIYICYKKKTGSGSIV